MRFSTHAALLYLTLHTTPLSPSKKGELIKELEVELSKDPEPEPEPENIFEELRMPVYPTSHPGFKVQERNEFKEFIKGRQSKKHKSKKRK